jgi:hypothetical protein
MTTYHDHLEAVNRGLADALAHLADLRLAMAELDAAGRYERPPSREALEPRAAGAEYLSLHFRKRPEDGFYSPTGKRKLYVGADPAAQSEARRLAENARRWEVLDRAARRLEDRIYLRQSQLQTLAERCQEWPRAELLGPVDDTAELGEKPQDLEGRCEP